MTARLPDELVMELERVGDQPLRVENPHNHKFYVIVAEDRFTAVRDEPAADSEWTEEKNARRFLLIDKEIAGTITQEESLELRQLQFQIDDYLRKVAPLPLAAARELHEELRRSLGNNAQR